MTWLVFRLRSQVSFHRIFCWHWGLTVTFLLVHTLPLPLLLESRASSQSSPTTWGTEFFWVMISNNSLEPSDWRTVELLCEACDSHFSGWLMLTRWRGLAPEDSWHAPADEVCKSQWWRGSKFLGYHFWSVELVYSECDVTSLEMASRHFDNCNAPIRRLLRSRIKGKHGGVKCHESTASLQLESHRD